MCPREAANVGNVLCRVGAETTEGKASSEASGGSSSASSSTASSSTADTASASSLICVLSKALRHLLVPLPADVDANGASSDQPAGDGDAAFAAAQRAAEAAEAREQRAMEREFSAAYIALLIGFICKGQPTHATTALKELHEPTFARIGALLRGPGSAGLSQSDQRGQREDDGHHHRLDGRRPVTRRVFFWASRAWDYSRETAQSCCRRNTLQSRVVVVFVVVVCLGKSDG